MDFFNFTERFSERQNFGDVLDHLVLEVESSLLVANYFNVICLTLRNVCSRICVVQEFVFYCHFIL